MTDMIVDNFTEWRDDILLSTYLAERKGKDPLLYLSPDEKKVLAFDPNKTDQCLFAYELEAMNPDK